MANICDFEMHLVGAEKDIETFFNVLTQNGNVWMGRGAEAEIEMNDNEAVITGQCKWSVYAALVMDADSMKNQKETGKGSWTESQDWFNEHEFLSLYEACEKFNVNMEVYSREPGCEFQEHYKYENGEISEDTCNYSEEYNEETGDYECSGGFVWNFTISDVV